MQYRRLAPGVKSLCQNAEKAWFAICNAGGSPAEPDDRSQFGRRDAGATKHFDTGSLRRGLVKWHEVKEDRYKDRIYDEGDEFVAQDFFEFNAGCG